MKFEKYKMQDALIQEEEEGQRMDKNKAAAKAASEREKKQRKKVSLAVMITAASCYFCCIQNSFTCWIVLLTSQLGTLPVDWTAVSVVC